MNKKLDLMREGKMSRALITLSLPSIIGVLITSVYNFTDALFVGKISTAAISATTIIYPLVTLLPAIGLLFSNGASAYISEMLGANDKDKAEKILASSIAYTLITSLIIQVLILILMNPLLRMLGASETTFLLAKEYGTYVIGGGILQILAVSLANLVRSEGAVNLSMYSQLLGAILNIILNPIFIFTFDLGLGGAAIATLISQGISVLLLIHHYISKKSYLRLSIKNVSFSKEIFNPIILIGLPMFSTFIFQSIAIALLNKFSSMYGDSTIAAIGIVSKLCSIPTLAITGFSRGYQNIVAFNYGANNLERVKESTKLAIMWSTAFGIIASIAQVVFSKPLIRLFTSEFDVISIGSTALIANSILLFTFGFQTIYLVLMISTGRKKSGLFLSLGRQGIFFIPILLIFSKLFGLNGIFFTQAGADILTTFATFIVFKISLSKNMTRVETYSGVES
ncbi:MATE family efflux transporter [Clostridium sp.]|uniref:MATE family efflux transporter n=1 Tax=Clostridium sp. TaxID=1506 RepID=UPI0026078A7F|nr:MATE family efflux transporter [Clostridium sp.]